ncbi:hypothetical protein DPMN_133457 [Dreissena polymorpha]|uniref:Uncharacterized protein n=1 Tax=Dreissena polymorpha TaxID=45954 RepID=A0A9D4J9T1_DREPO|nr:hypothetical protein DPMN_133457 [Dreissena polymorpha]
MSNKKRHEVRRNQLRSFITSKFAINVCNDACDYILRNIKVEEPTIRCHQKSFGIFPRRFESCRRLSTLSVQIFSIEVTCSMDVYMDVYKTQLLTKFGEDRMQLLTKFGEDRMNTI